MEDSIEYFDKGGSENTLTTLQLAKDKALEKGIKNVAIASIRGQTLKKAFGSKKPSLIEIMIDPEKMAAATK